MNRPMTVLMAIAGWVATSALASAQPATPAEVRYEMALSGVLMQPRGDFLAALHTIGYGGGFQVLIPIGAGPVSVGADGQLLFYSAAKDRLGDEMILTVHGLMRLGRSAGPRRPYAEALMGMKGFSTDNRFPTYSYGVGAGLQFPLRRKMREGVIEQELMEIGVRYLRGGRARLAERRVTPSSHSVMLHLGWVLRRL